VAIGVILVGAVLLLHENKQMANNKETNKFFIFFSSFSLV
jgi:hypothetical protein